MDEQRGPGCFGLLVIIGVAVWAFYTYSGNFWSDHQRQGFFDTCIEQGMGGFTCSCIIDWFEENDYSPNDLEGEDYPSGALQAALDCPGF